jgi:hypothetical protein
MEMDPPHVMKLVLCCTLKIFYNFYNAKSNCANQVDMNNSMTPKVLAHQSTLIHPEASLYSPSNLRWAIMQQQTREQHRMFNVWSF